MAKENSVVLVGKITTPPTQTYTSADNLYHITFIMEVRRKNQHVDFPEVTVYGLTEEYAAHLVNALNNSEDAYIMVRGMISTQPKEITTICPHCGKEQKIHILHTSVSTIIMPLLLHGKYSEGDLTEYANRASVMGIVCKAPAQRLSQNGMLLTQYQIVLNRGLRIPEQPDFKEDYPWVKSINGCAEESSRHLKVGSQVYITGSLQTREREKTILCSNCNSAVTFHFTVAEIFVKSVEYLANCVFRHNKPDKCNNSTSQKKKHKILLFIEKSILKRGGKKEKLSS